MHRLSQICQDLQGLAQTCWDLHDIILGNTCFLLLRHYDGYYRILEDNLWSCFYVKINSVKMLLKQEFRTHKNEKEKIQTISFQHLNLCIKRAYCYLPWSILQQTVLSDSFPHTRLLIASFNFVFSPWFETDWIWMNSFLVSGHFSYEMHCWFTEQLSVFKKIKSNKEQTYKSM